MSDGSIRRVRARYSDGQYACWREISSAAQEAARERLARDDGTRGRDESERDRRLLAGVATDSLETPNVFEAYAFLGADATARSALMEANPRLVQADFRD